MPFKEVKELRKSGKLHEALQKANRDLENDPANIWNKRSIAWVYYEFLKQNASIEEVENFIEYLAKLKSLELPDDEKMIFDSCAYQIGKIVFKLATNEQVNYNNINSIFELIKDFHFTKPSEAYSFLYKAFHKSYKNWSNYILFADWWAFENFDSNDFLSEEFNDKKLLSIVEQAYIAYSKKLLEGEAQEVGGYLLPKAIDKAKIKNFLPKLDAIIENHQEYQYPPYFKAKLLLALGDEKGLLSNFLPFAKSNRNNFWVWELLSDIFHSNEKRKMACLCKALSLRTPDEFLINSRQKLAELLIKENKLEQAKTEIQKILLVRNENNWKIPQQLTEWIEQDWYKTTQAQKDNSSFYNKYAEIAEDILFSDIQEEVVVVEFVNVNKSIINFVKDKTKHGFFKYARMIENPAIGDLISVRFTGESQNGFYKVLSVKKVTDSLPCEAIKEFRGNLKMSESANFGFVEDVFIELRLILKQGLNKNDVIKGKAVLSFNKKKNLWGWKAIKVD